jgi:hypothetical protein
MHARALSLPDILAGMSDRLGFLTTPARRRELPAFFGRGIDPMEL